MENYIVSARKYRPGTFASVVGQSHVTNTLKSAIKMGQLAHAFLFSGPRGVGKTTCARILAKAINCENLQESGEPCNECESCVSFNDGKSMTIHELDAASNNSVDDIRNLIEQTRYVPTPGKSGQARRSVYIIDEVHMLTQAAFNAFLKTLEEPPAHVLFILATTEKHKILPTILSRCQKHDFRRIRVDDIAKHLEYISKEEGMEYDFAALQQIALKADGALRDALSLYDQLVSYTSGKLSFESVLENLNILDYEYYFKAVDAMRAQDHQKLLLLFHEVIEKGFEAKDFALGLTEHFRNLLVCQSPETLELLETSENVKARYQEQSQAVEASFLLNAFNLCTDTEQKSKQATHPRLLVELLLIKLAHLTQAIRVAEDGGAEKKKSIANGQNGHKKVSNPEVPTAKQSNPEQVKVVAEVQAANSPVVNPVIPEEKTAPVSKEKQIPVAKPEKKVIPKGKRLGKLANLSSLKEAVQEENKNRKDTGDSEQKKTYTIQKDIHISEVAFSEHLNKYFDILKMQNKHNLANILEASSHKFTHNCWHLTVPEGLKLPVEKDQEMLPYLREKLHQPNLFVEIIEGAPYVNPNDQRPYTEEEKLNEMSVKNPALLELQKKFKTRIIY